MCVVCFGWCKQQTQLQGRVVGVSLQSVFSEESTMTEWHSMLKNYKNEHFLPTNYILCKVPLAARALASRLGEEAEEARSLTILQKPSFLCCKPLWHGWLALLPENSK